MYKIYWMIKDGALFLKAGEIEGNINSVTELQSCFYFSAYGT